MDYAVTDRPASSLGSKLGASAAERPLLMLGNRLCNVTSKLDEQLSMLADAQTNTINRMIGDQPLAPEEARAVTADGPGRMLHFGGDIMELETAVMRLEQTVQMVIDRHRHVTNRLTSVG